MAKELPYFRFTPQEWQNGDISLERFELRGIFIDICSYYWVKDCSITTAMLHKRYSNDNNLVQELVNLGIIQFAENEEYVKISFLDEQFDMLSEQRKRRQKAGSKGGKRKSSNAKAELEQNPSYKDKDKDKENDKDKDKEKINGEKPPVYIFSFKSELLKLGVDKQVIEDWIKVRKLKKAKDTITSFQNIENQIKKSGLSANECIKIAVEKDWKGFNSDWLKDNNTTSQKFDPKKVNDKWRK